VEGLRFGVLTFGFWIKGWRHYASRFWVQGLGFRVDGSGFKVWALRFKVKGSQIRV